MLAVVLALASSVTWGAGDFLGGLQSRRMPVLTVLAVSRGLALLAIVLAVLLGASTVHDGAGTLWAATGGVVGLVALTAFYRGLSIGTMSVVAPISSTGTVVPVLVGIVSGERPSAIQLCGMALAAGGVIVASREAPGADAAARRTNRLAIVLALLAAAGFGFFFVAMDRAHDHADVAWVLLAARAPDAVIFGALIALGAAGRARRVRLPVRPPSLSRPPGGVAGLLPLAGVGLADGGANLLFTLATAEGLLSVVGVLGSLYPVMTVVLARALLGERLTRLQDGGVLATLAGVIVIAGG